MQTLIEFLQWQHLVIFTIYCVVAAGLFQFGQVVYSNYLQRKQENAERKEFRQSIQDALQRKIKEYAKAINAEPPAAAAADQDSTVKQPVGEMRLDDAWRAIIAHVLSNVKSSLETNHTNPAVKQWAEYQQQAINKTLVNYTGDAVTLARPQDKSYVSPVITAALMHSFLASPVVEHEIKFYKP